MAGIPEMYFITGTPPDVHPMLEDVNSARVAWVALPFSKMHRFVSILISQARFIPTSSGLAGMATASRTRGDASSLVGPRKEELVLKWRSDPRGPDSVLACLESRSQRRLRPRPNLGRGNEGCRKCDRTDASNLCGNKRRHRLAT